MDPLSDVLALLKPKSVISGGFAVNDNFAVSFPQHTGIKCYAVLSGQCWLTLQGHAPLQLTAGSCFLLPRGLPFSLATDPDITPTGYRELIAARGGSLLHNTAVEGNYLVGGFFALTGSHADFLLKFLPPIVHIQKESDKAAMRWSLERMCEELRDPQPGGTLVTEQLAYMMLIQALRLHLADSDGVGWFFALADPQMKAAISAMHEAPAQRWTLQDLAQRAGMSRSIFALRFKQAVGISPMEYLTRWRMMLAGQRLTSTSDAVAQIASSLGYDSESAFSKAFRRYMVHSPREHRRDAAARAA